MLPTTRDKGPLAILLVCVLIGILLVALPNLAGAATIESKHLVLPYEVDPMGSFWNMGMRAARQAGGMKLYEHVRKNWGDWVVTVLFLPEGEKLLFTNETQFAIAYGDSVLIPSREIIYSPTQTQRQVRTNGWGFSVAHGDPITAMKSKAHVLLVRYPGGSVPRAGDGEMVFPDSTLIWSRKPERR